MPKRTDLKSILIIGAGPIIIGQACEFDYSGTQACKALKAEGYLVETPPLHFESAAIDFNFCLAIHWRVERQHHANRRTRVHSDLGSVDLKDKIGITIGHARRLIEPRRDIDHGEHPQPGSDPIKVSERAFKTSEVGQRHQTR